MDITTLLAQIESPRQPARVDLREVATAYVAAGISILPIKGDGTKQPAGHLLTPITDDQGTDRSTWGPLQSRLPTADELRRWYGCFGGHPGIAAITGPISGGLECIDFDDKDSFEPWATQLHATAPDLLDRLVLIRTPRPGIHAFYRSPAVGSSTKLAEATVIDPQTNQPQRKTLIETRGTRGYAIVPPSPTYCHPSHRPYLYVSERTLLNLEVLSAEERALMLELARSFNQLCPEPQRVPTHRQSRSAPGRRFSVIDDYNNRVSWQALLRKHGWTFLQVSPDGVEHWRRPGKRDGGTSASLFYGGSNVLYVFSSNAAPLEPETSYSPFQFRAWMEFNGDLARTCRALTAEGYGSRSSSVRIANGSRR